MKYDLIESFNRILRDKGMTELSVCEKRILDDINNSGFSILEGLRGCDAIDTRDSEISYRKFTFNSRLYKDAFVMKVYQDHATFETTLPGALLKMKYSFGEDPDLDMYYIRLDTFEANRESDILTYRYYSDDKIKKGCKVEIYTDVFGVVKDSSPDQPIPDFAGTLEDDGYLKLVDPKNYLPKGNIDYFYNHTTRGKANEVGCMLYEMDDIYRSTCKLNGKQRVLK